MPGGGQPYVYTCHLSARVIPYTKPTALADAAAAAAAAAAKSCGIDSRTPVRLARMVVRKVSVTTKRYLVGQPATRAPMAGKQLLIGVAVLGRWRLFPSSLEIHLHFLPETLAGTEAVGGVQRECGRRCSIVAVIFGVCG